MLTKSRFGKLLWRRIVRQAWLSGSRVGYCSRDLSGGALFLVSLQRDASSPSKVITLIRRGSGVGCHNCPHSSSYNELRDDFSRIYAPFLVRRPDGAFPCTMCFLLRVLSVALHSRRLSVLICMPRAYRTTN